MRRPENNLSSHLEWLRSCKATVPLQKDALGLFAYDGPVAVSDRPTIPAETRQNGNDDIVETAARSSDNTRGRYWLLLMSNGIWINRFFLHT